VLEKAACLAHHSTKLERNGLKMGADPLATGWFQRPQQSIALGFICLCFGHGDTVHMLMVPSPAESLRAIGRNSNATATTPGDTRSKLDGKPDASISVSAAKGRDEKAVSIPRALWLFSARGEVGKVGSA